MTTRNPRRAYTKDGTELRSMALGNMRYHGVRSVDATCQACQHEATILVDMLSDHVPVPDVALMLVCSVCGSRNIDTRPDWREHKAPGMHR